MIRVKRALANTWLFPRYIHLLYMREALKGAREHVRGRLLDVGCGLRQYEELVSDRVTQYVGMDWPVIAGRARADVIGDALRIPIRFATVDTVLATELMEHLADPIGFLTEAARVLRTGGVLVLSVPFMEPLHEEPRDYYRFTPYGLRRLLEEQGFVVQHIWSKGGWWSVVLGSFVSQSLYDLANPADAQGARRDGILAALVLPLCALAQSSAYALDRLFRTSRYTLGYVAIATLSERNGCVRA